MQKLSYIVIANKILLDDIITEYKKDPKFIDNKEIVSTLLDNNTDKLKKFIDLDDYFNAIVNHFNGLNNKHQDKAFKLLLNHMMRGYEEHNQLADLVKKHKIDKNIIMDNLKDITVLLDLAHDKKLGYKVSVQLRESVL